MYRRNVKIAALCAMVASATVLLIYFVSSHHPLQNTEPARKTADSYGEGAGAEDGENPARFARNRALIGDTGNSPNQDVGEAGNAKDGGRSSGCAGVDTSAIVSWKRGLVTEIQPNIVKNCEKLKLSIPQEQASVRLALRSWKPRETNEEYRRRMTECPQVWSEFSEHNFYNSQKEVDFPIAYVLVFHNNTRQIIRLLKVLWRPQNVFCLHPDAKQGPEFVSFFQTFASCFDNVIIASKLERVIYAHHTIMDAQLNCMEGLLALKESRWKYTITLCGTELPLKTNREMVAGLKRLKGGSGIATHAMDDNAKSRFDKKIEIGPKNDIHFTTTTLGPPPHGIELRKSWDFFALTRPFMEFILTDKRAIDFREYCRGVFIPEEHFFASLYWMRDAPSGEYRRDKTGVVPLVEDMLWKEGDTRVGPPCAGRIVHGICILSSGDLGTVYKKGVLSHTNRFFYNKYFMHLDHVVMDCMEERLVQENKMEYVRDCLL